MDIHKRECFFANSDIGWVVGHSFVVYGPLLKGAATILYEGKPIGTPDAGIYWKLIEKYRIKSMFTSPTAVRSIRREDINASLLKKYDISSLKSIFIAGERCDVLTFKWV